MEFPILISWKVPFTILLSGARYISFLLFELKILYASSGDTDQMPHSVVSDLDLYCLPKTLDARRFGFFSYKYSACL